MSQELDARLLEWLKARRDCEHVLLDQQAVEMIITLLEKQAGGNDMTTTKPPVLSDAAITETAARLGWDVTCNDTLRSLVHLARFIESLVLERAGADAVRDAALEEAAALAETHANQRECAGFGAYDSRHLARGIRALKGTPAAAVEPFQARVQPWMMACFGEMIAGDREERNHRFLEESLELVQSLGCTASEAHQLVGYVYGRPVGEPAQEVGGVMVTLAALCLANDLDMHEAGETELTRIWTKVEQIRAKQAAKPKHSPLPAAVVVADHLQWAVDRWNDEVLCRPLVNVHRRILDDTWRQVMRHFGGNPDALVGLDHDRLIAANPIKPQPSSNPGPLAAVEQAEFKNFHRLLCERFGYVHDDADWQRDQLSLIEHIAAVEPSGNPGQLPSAASIATAPACLNLNDKAMWVTGWNECRAAIAASKEGASQ